MLEVLRADIQPTPAELPKGTVDLDQVREQMDRILASDTFHNAEVLRRFLKFLAEKTLAGEADNLKEYSVGLDALGKPATYDPRQDAAVRLQASRLRIKLDQYYRAEGSDDPLIIEMPKGRFKLAWRPKDVLAPPVHGVRSASSQPISAEPHEIKKAELRKWRSTAIALSGICLVLVFSNAWSVLRLSRLVNGQRAVASTPELDAFWSPFLSSPHHVVLAFSNPLFVRFQRKGQRDLVYREREMTDWSDAVSSPDFALPKRTLGNPSATPSENFVERSNLVIRSSRHRRKFPGGPRVE